MNNAITKENLLFTLPGALKEDESAQALAQAAAEELAARLHEIDRLRVIPNVDGLDEGVLDILARDFKVDWWDANFNLAEKRRTLKSSWRVHKTLGTKAAVDEAISAIYPNSHATPWFEYGGEPYHFRFDINTSEETGASLEKQARVLELAKYYRSLRDRLDELLYTLEAKEEAAFRLGMTAATVVRFPVPEAAEDYRFQQAARTGGGGAVVASMPVPEAAEAFSFRGAIRTGGGGAITARLNVPEE